MSLFKKSREPENAEDATIVFEVDRGYDGRLLGKSRPVSVLIDGNPAATLMPGESLEVTVRTGKHRFTFSHKDGKTHQSRDISGNGRCFIREADGDTEISWNRGGSILNGSRTAAAGLKSEAKVFFRAEAGLTGRDRSVEISIDGIRVATLKAGERYQHTLETGTHVFQFGGELSRQAVQSDLGCFIQIGRRIEFEFFDPKSVLAKNRLRN